MIYFIFGWIYTIAFSICYIPQIVKTIKTKKVDDISISLFILSLIGYVSALIYAVGELNAPAVLIANYIFGALCSTLMIALYYIFKLR